MQTARAWYDSPPYLEEGTGREGAAVGSFIVVEGVIQQ